MICEQTNVDQSVAHFGNSIQACDILELLGIMSQNIQRNIEVYLK